MSADVTVVIPTYNRAATLPASLGSVLAQKDVALEVVVVDDGSTDDTPAVLAAIPDSRLRIVRGPHAGIAAARNTGLAVVTTPYVAFHDSDDLALPGRLGRPIAWLREHPDDDLVIQNGRMLVPEDDPTAAETPWIAPAVARTLVDRPVGVGDVFRWNLGQLQGMTFTRRALAATGPLDESFRILDDLDLVLRVVVRFRAVFLDVPAFAYRRHAGGIARDRVRVREESIRLADKLVAEHPEVLDRLGRHAFHRRQARRWSRLGTMRLRTGDRTGAREAFDRARRLDPFDVRERLAALWRRLRGDG